MADGLDHSCLNPAACVVCLSTARLRSWKAEAMEVLSDWDKVFDALGQPGRLGESKAAASLAEVQRLVPSVEHDTYEDRITDERNLALRRESGRVNDDRPLVSFLYLLMRDHMAAGVVEESVRAVEDSKPSDPEQSLERLIAYLNASGLSATDLTSMREGSVAQPSSFTNGYLARYAQHLVDRLT